MLERQRATDMSKEALHRTSTHIAILSSTLQTLHDRHTYLTSRLMSHVLVGWLRGVEALWRRVRGSELDLARMRQVVGRCESGGVAGTKDEVHVWRGISRILCEELVRVGGEKNGVRQEVDGDSIMEDQVEDEHHHLSTHDIIDEYYV